MERYFSIVQIEFLYKTEAHFHNFPLEKLIGGEIWKSVVQNQTGFALLTVGVHLMIWLDLLVAISNTNNETLV